MINTYSFRVSKFLRFKNCIYITRIRKESTSIIETKIRNQEQWEKKMKFYMKVYEDLFGITKLTEMQEKVIDIQLQLGDVQEKRRKLQEEIFTVQKKLQEMQDILHKTSMGDDMYISVVTQVRELLKDQKRLQDLFSLYDQTEREQQTTLALAINNSQDQERTYREKNKYLSLITGIVGAVVGLLGSSINNWRHRKDIKHFALDISQQVSDLKKSVEELNSAVSNEESMFGISAIESSGTKGLMTTIETQQNTLQDSIKSLQTVLNGGSLSQRTNNHNNVSDEHFNNLFNEFEKSIDSRLKNYAYINVGLIGSCAAFTVLLFLYIARNG